MLCLQMFIARARAYDIVVPHYTLAVKVNIVFYSRSFINVWYSVRTSNLEMISLM